MKKTIKEAMKHINLLDQQINTLLNEERMNSYVEYATEKDKEISDYNFENTTNEILNFQDHVLKIRKAINKANQETLIGVDNLTISDGLIKLAQLNNNAQRLEQLASYKQKSRIDTYSDTTQYSERLYDVKKVRKLHLECVEEIHKLQTAIDKANILTEIEI